MRAGARFLLCDNMSTELLRTTVDAVRATGEQVEIEATGNFTSAAVDARDARAAATLRQVDLAAFDALATSLAGVRRRNEAGAARWVLDGRLVARELDRTHVVVRVPFDVRDALLRRSSVVFSVPRRLQKHLMVVADLAGGDDGAVEDALEAAWSYQRQSAGDGSTARDG